MIKEEIWTTEKLEKFKKFIDDEFKKQENQINQRKQIRDRKIKIEKLKSKCTQN